MLSSKDPLFPRGAALVDSGPAGGPERLIVNGANEAERLLEDLAALHPTYADVRYRLGLLKLSRGRHACAEREFEEALGIHPGYRNAYYGLRLTHWLQGRPPQGHAASFEGTAPPQDSVWAIVDRAYELGASGGNPLEAFAAGPGTESLLHHHYAAGFAAQRGEADSVERHLRAAARLSETSAAVLGSLGWSDGCKSETMPGGGLGELLWSPLAADLYAYFGRVYARNGLHEEAVRCFGRAFLVLPDEARHARHQAEIAVARGEEERAIELLSLAVERDPSCAEARIALGFEYAAQGFLTEARVQFEAAAKLAPDYADVRYNLGLLYAGEDRSEEALQEFRRALSVNPAYLPARRSLAALLQRLGRLEEALREGDRILRQGFASPDLLVQMAQASLAVGRIDQALERLLRAEALNPDYAPTYYWLGQVYRHQQQRNKARSAWQRYLEKSRQSSPPLQDPGPVSPAGTGPAAEDPA
jgi:tetratricopeptide (TPR) repeat protein